MRETRNVHRTFSLLFGRKNVPHVLLTFVITQNASRLKNKCTHILVYLFNKFVFISRPLLIIIALARAPLQKMKRARARD